MTQSNEGKMEIKVSIEWAEGVRDMLRNASGILTGARYDGKPVEWVVPRDSEEAFEHGRGLGGVPRATYAIDVANRLIGAMLDDRKTMMARIAELEASHAE